MSQEPDPAAVGENVHLDQLISFDSREHDGAYVVTVSGEVDMATTPHLRSYLNRQLEKTQSLLVIDLRGITFLASSGLAALVETLEAARERNVRLRLVCDSREVVRPLEATGLTELFDIHSDPTEALESVDGH